MILRGCLIKNVFQYPAEDPGDPEIISKEIIAHCDEPFSLHTLGTI